ncbi:5'-(N(7)-methyl 5'-triphosphoguanosine)-[mRNA] diphosphatase [Malassezia cuniculi]|uniref:5'-(N(7)-methyl 5'-triphosphoguanosine)-[mRNA] diphosphatase n=1 Tax=Malassezia cuniculi TaxID=948313 RepID=A0AAF0EPU4_9BASI|nr:5'-(N(7)-methyl 5'-triphosphoguanosine)-[mRNA] diphosphatase [Malassezia cuniculi]
MSLHEFKPKRVLNEDPRARTVNVLGECQIDGNATQAVLLVEKTHFASNFIDRLRDGSAFERLECIGQNDIYTWEFGWLGGTDAHTKMTLICPASDDVVAKYSACDTYMVLETPEVYKNVTEPWIASIPAKKKQWVYNILEGISEQESVLYSDDDEQTGFMLLPDLKWDRRTVSSLYLTAIVRDRSIATLRDLRKEHVPMLKKIKEQGERVAREKFGLVAADEAFGTLRCFVHYMPTFFHFHVHLLAADYSQHPGAVSGKAHMLDDIISLLELGVDFKQRTIGYALTAGHPLVQELSRANKA